MSLEQEIASIKARHPEACAEAKLLVDLALKAQSGEAIDINKELSTTQQVSVPMTWVVETSTNLVDWETVLVTQDPAEADNTVGTNIEAAPEPMRFFRTWSR